MAHAAENSVVSHVQLRFGANLKFQENRKNPNRKFFPAEQLYVRISFNLASKRCTFRFQKPGVEVTITITCFLITSLDVARDT